MHKKDLGLLILILVVGLFGLFAIGQGFVIITGGIERSAGSMIALLGVLFVDLVANKGVPWPLGVALIVLLGLLMGWPMASSSPV